MPGSTTASRLVCWILVLLAVPLLCAHGTANSESGAIYFISATPPQSGSPLSYPAALYRVGDKGKLLLIRQLFTADQYFRDIGDDFRGKMYVAGQNGVFVIHEDDPTREDYVSYENYDDFPCWAVVRGDQIPSGMQYCSTDQLMRVLGGAELGKPRVGPGSWAAFKFLQYGGEIGGPFQVQPPLAELAGAKIMLPYTFPPNVELAELPKDLYVDPAERRRVEVLADTDQYLIVWVRPASMVTKQSITTEDTRHQEPLQVRVLDKHKGSWRTLELPTAITLFSYPTVRLFGDWLVTTVTHFDASRPFSPGYQNERGEISPNHTKLPDIQDWYMNNLIYLFFPGELTLQNLSNGRIVSLKTGQQDSEVLAIGADGRILYRVNDEIYSSSVLQTHLAPPTVLVKGDSVEDVHWAFWGPATKNGKMLGERQ